MLGDILHCQSDIDVSDVSVLLLNNNNLANVSIAMDIVMAYPDVMNAVSLSGNAFNTLPT